MASFDPSPKFETTTLKWHVTRRLASVRGLDTSGDHPAIIGMGRRLYVRRRMDYPNWGMK